MQVVDANVLIYAVNADSPHHETARNWLDQALSQPGGVGMPWIVLLAFIRIVTNARIMPYPMSTEDALSQVEAWLSSPAALIVDPTPRHLTVLASLLRDTKTGANLINDAHIAAMALDHGATVISFDRDFGRFAGLNHEVPA
ncbi:MAG TPA: type II toxin-antitoxin system VapC family toxin [Microthrixaceae bacterium]|nr:type II toxin-antitoxin system VapC family toxin [Microthrixaceae bacterium]